MEVSVFSVLVCLLTFLFFLVSEVLGNTELAKEVTGVAGVQSCKYILIHDWCGNSVLFLLFSTCAGNPELMTTPGNHPLFQALKAFTEKMNSVFSLKPHLFCTSVFAYLTLC